jgi:hypothetical protein
MSYLRIGWRPGLWTVIASSAASLIALQCAIVKDYLGFISSFVSFRYRAKRNFSYSIWFRPRFAAKRVLPVYFDETGQFIHTDFKQALRGHASSLKARSMKDTAVLKIVSFVFVLSVVLSPLGQAYAEMFLRLRNPA